MGSGNWIALGVTDCTSFYPIYCAQTDYANAVTVPPSSNPLAFLTKGYFDTATGLASADQLCSSEASAAGLQYPTSYRALLGTKTMAPAARFSTTSPYRRPDDVTMNTTTDSFFDKTKRWLAPIDVAADKTYLGAAEVAIGSLDPTVPGANTCNDWTVDTSAAKMDHIQTYRPDALQHAYAVDCQKYAKVICLYSNQ
jgi:hypothetical protein